MCWRALLLHRAGHGQGWKWLAKLFAAFAALAGLMGIGTITQINGITSAVQTVFDPAFDQTGGLELFGRSYSWSVVISGFIVTLLVCLVLIGGLQRIAGVSSVIVPFMALTYLALSLTLLVCNFTRLPGAFLTIIRAAFDPAAVTGGAVGSIFVAMQKGVAGASSPTRPAWAPPPSPPLPPRAATPPARASSACWAPSSTPSSSAP